MQGIQKASLVHFMSLTLLYVKTRQGEYKKTNLLANFTCDHRCQPFE